MKGAPYTSAKRTQRRYERTNEFALECHPSGTIGQCIYATNGIVSTAVEIWSICSAAKRRRPNGLCVRRGEDPDGTPPIPGSLFPSVLHPGHDLDLAVPACDRELSFMGSGQGLQLVLCSSRNRNSIRTLQSVKEKQECERNAHLPPGLINRGTPAS